MFHPGSRYAKQITYSVATRAGVVQVTTLPLDHGARIRGFHRRTEGQRLDLIANYYLSDPTAFWRLCDASGQMAPDALSARDLVGVPFKRG
ncbi:MAG: LysM domain-containing protein [Minicystis sp.]